MNGEVSASQEQEASKKPPGDASMGSDPLVGTRLDGRFEVEEVLGAGGMSIVYKAKQLRVNRHVAIKTIRTQLGRNAVHRDRFQREIDSLCALNHPNIVTVYDCFFGDDGQPYIVMDYLRGRSLETLIDQDGPLNIERFTRVAVQVCNALEHAHKNGIVHRDLKPGNIVLLDDEADFVKVVDFGLAKMGEENRKLTQQGEVVGSPPYMSPEQCLGKSGDVRSDIYSLGIVMYEMLTGFDPFHSANSVYELLQLHANALPPYMKQKNPDIEVSPQLEQAIFKALEKAPADRYQSALEFQEALIAASSAGKKDSGDLLLHVSPKATPASATPIPANNYSPDYFNRALDPMAGEDLSGFGQTPSTSPNPPPISNVSDPSVATYAAAKNITIDDSKPKTNTTNVLAIAAITLALLVLTVLFLPKLLPSPVAPDKPAVNSVTPNNQAVQPRTAPSANPTPPQPTAAKALQTKPSTTVRTAIEQEPHKPKLKPSQAPKTVAPTTAPRSPKTAPAAQKKPQPTGNRWDALQNLRHD